jgi:hypothetical protein
VASANATNTTVTSSVNPSVYGQKVTFTATVAAVVGSTKPTGTVTFKDGTTVLGSATLNNQGVANFTTSAFALAVGGNSITANYAGSTQFAGSGSTTLTQTVNQDTTTATLKSSLATAVVGQNVTFTATVTANSPGSGTPTGTVTFYNGNTFLGQGTLSSTGKATLTTSSLPAGNDPITVSYAGDSHYQASTSSSPLTQTITQAATRTVVASSNHTTVLGQSVTFTATVTVRTPGAGTPTGTVLFMDGSTVLGPGTLNGAGQATYTTSALLAGSHSITAVYQGDSNFTTSTSAAITQRVLKAGTNATVSSSQTSVPPGTPVTFTATVVSTAAGAGVPTGTVTFYDGSTVLGTMTLNGSGQAMLPKTWTTAGAHKIKVKYSGDANFDPIASAVITETVT